MQQPFLSVVIPFYNEERTAAAVIEQHASRIAQCGISDWEILCLNDASTDNTGAILNACASRIPNVRVLNNAVNQGIAASFQRLFHEASGTHIYLTAGDNQWPAENLPRLWKTMQATKADIVIGVRENRHKVYSPWRRMVSYGFNAAARVLFGMDVQDANGIKLARKEIMVLPLVSKSFFSEIERLLKAKEKGYCFAFCPVVFVARTHGQAKGSSLKNLCSTVVEMFAYAFRK